MTSIIAVAGSLRRQSWNRRLAAEAARLGPTAGLDVSVFNGLADIPLFDQDLDDSLVAGPPGVEAVRAQVRAADGILIATPEYNQSIPGVMKNLVDWLSRPEDQGVLEGKPVAIIGATDGPWGTRYAQKELRHTLTAAGALVLPQPMLFVARAPDLFDAGGRLTDAVTKRRLTELLRAFDRWIGLMSALSHVDAVAG
ncbi:MAG TPA: NADPH-dependent FMN reductase [Candidatus Limnocylindrales bacterium]|nr:NADPH-dependent FMN reductase [Candidatus Limnocylindrales bacterium]